MMPDRSDVLPEDIEPVTSEETHAIVDALINDLHDRFHDYVSGEFSFEDLTFEMFATLQTLHAVATGRMSVEWETDDSDIEDLAGEPLREADADRNARNRRKGRGRRGH